MAPRLLLLRHGQITANRVGRWHGSTDSPLTLRGRWQAWRTGRYLSENGGRSLYEPTAALPTYRRISSTGIHSEPQSRKRSCRDVYW